MGVERAAAVVAVELRAEGFVALHDVETLRSISSRAQSVLARTVAERGYRLMQVISPKRSPGPSLAMGLS